MVLYKSVLPIATIFTLRKLYCEYLYFVQHTTNCNISFEELNRYVSYCCLYFVYPENYERQVSSERLTVAVKNFYKIKSDNNREYLISVYDDLIDEFINNEVLLKFITDLFTGDFNKSTLECCWRTTDNYVTINVKTSNDKS